MWCLSLKGEIDLPLKAEIDLPLMAEIYLTLRAESDLRYKYVNLVNQSVNFGGNKDFSIDFWGRIRIFDTNLSNTCLSELY